MNNENLKDELKPFYEKGDCCSWIVELRKDKYQLQQENNKLLEEKKKAIEIIKREFLCYDNESDEYKWGKILLEILGDKE